jgi:hypothetical protein
VRNNVHIRIVVVESSDLYIWILRGGKERLSFADSAWIIYFRQ